MQEGVVIYDELVRALAVVEAVDQDVDGLGHAGRLRTLRPRQRVDQGRPVLRQRQREAEGVLEIHREVARQSAQLPPGSDGAGVDWSRVELWWGDERFVPADDGERNAGQARRAWLDQVGVDPAQQINPFAS